jgi:hypothetical protein
VWSCPDQIDGLAAVRKFVLAALVTTVGVGVDCPTIPALGGRSLLLSGETLLLHV